METVEMTIISRRDCEERLARLQEEYFPITDQYLCGVSSTPVILTKVRIKLSKNF
jgi:hypothetical protein